VGVDAIKSLNGLEFELGSSARILYINSGASEDWAYGVAQVPYTYCLELRPGQTGVDSNYGFALPENRVPKAGEETYSGIKAFLGTLLV
jgi:carboxypeptidase A2